ncbi:hypothetical protein SE18_25910 [Herpetosiphon geysericola]|uniref:Uncharacterized protein n=1 Tax=Herpetosiphon geysericola TaxID=70996 RepID=A0A0P6XWT0_9CHLR|nr:hypothetical protein SE18_25910 [Herpetosiphon geysericola]
MCIMVSAHRYEQTYIDKWPPKTAIVATPHIDPDRLSFVTAVAEVQAAVREFQQTDPIDHGRLYERMVAEFRPPCSHSVAYESIHAWFGNAGQKFPGKDQRIVDGVSPMDALRRRSVWLGWMDRLGQSKPLYQPIQWLQKP